MTQYIQLNDGKQIDVRDLLYKHIEAGYIDGEHLLYCCLRYMSASDIKEMLEINQLEKFLDIIQ